MVQSPFQSVLEPSHSLQEDMGADTAAEHNMCNMKVTSFSVCVSSGSM